MAGLSHGKMTVKYSEGWLVDTAVVVLSRQGKFVKTVAARDIHSHEHARKLWPLVTPSEPRSLVTWVRPVFDSANMLKRRSHFRLIPGSTGAAFRQKFDLEEAARVRAAEESREHKRAKHLVAEALRDRMNQNLGMPWFFKDPDASDFHLAGNLLLGAAEVVEERTVKTFFGCSYRLDIGIVSKTIEKGGLLLGGIEIEWEHQFDGRKALIGKSQAFPLISIDITGLQLNELTPEWADMALTGTTRSSDTGRRITYIYLHDLLYPQYLQVQREVVKETRHQFVVFAPDEDLQKLLQLIPKYRAALQVPEKALAISMMNAKSESSKVAIANLGDVVGADWAEINSTRALMVTLDRPTQFDENLQLLHLCLANLLLSFTDSLVGYKYMLGILNDDTAKDIWEHSVWNKDARKFERYRIAPKRLAEPRSRLLAVLNGLIGEQR